MADLVVGSHGDAVVEVQQLLNQQLNPSPNLPANGTFGQSTRSAVVLYQTTHGLPPTGRVDDATLSALRGTTTPGLGFAGIDVLGYPGDARMAWLWENTNLYWTGFYLAPAPSQGYTGWMRSYNTLRNQGWGFAPLYVGRQAVGPGSHAVTAANGTRDGQDAATLAARAGFPGGSVIYLDIEQGPPMMPHVLDYWRAWVDSLLSHGYAPAAYCSYTLALQFIAADARAAAPWAFKMLSGIGRSFQTPFPDMAPAGSGIGSAEAWQYAQNVSITADNGHHLAVDLDVADWQDPSRPWMKGSSADANSPTALA
jgi:hypothetical protein